MLSCRPNVLCDFGQLTAIVIVPTLCLVLSGCGNGLAQVSGKVTVDGQSLKGDDVRVSVRFEPASGVGAAAVAIADENGNYKLSTGSQNGIAPGDYYVACSASELVRSKGSNTVQGGRQITDPKFSNAKTSGLKFTVQSGKNEFDIPLQSPPKTPARSHT